MLVERKEGMKSLGGQIGRGISQILNGGSRSPQDSLLRSIWSPFVP